MKTCPDCKKDFPLEGFPRKNSNKRGCYCRSCANTRNRASYRRLDNSYRKNALLRAKKQKKKVRVIRRTWMLEYLKLHPCIECREADPIVLEFDHRDPKQKEFTIGERFLTYGWQRILDEIEKCDVRCANCHRRKTNVGTYRDVV